MTQLFMDGFDHYGSGSSGRDAALNGAWDELAGNVTLAFPAPGARTGPMAIKGDALSSDMRRALGLAATTCIAGFAVFCDTLPDDPNIHRLWYFRDVFNTTLLYLATRPDGALEVRNEAGTILATTTGPVINAASWQHIEAKIFVDTGGATGTIEVRVDEISVLSLGGLTLGVNGVGIVAMQQGGGAGDPNRVYWDDIVVRDDTGAVNNDFEGDLRVATLQPVVNGVNQGWTTRSIQKLGVGVLDLIDKGSDAGIMYDDEPEFELGSGDYCIEGFFYFDVNLVLSEETTLFSKWRESTNEASYRLKLTGPDNGNNLEFSTSVLGTLADEVVVHSVGFTPLPKQYYHIAVAREGGVSRLYIDGVRTGGDQADVRNYFNGAADLVVSGKQSGTTSIVANSGVNGFADGVRLTVGAARYTAQFFTPPTDILPSTVGGDPLYNSVELLLNFDEATVIDDSVNAFVVSTFPGGEAVTLLPDDEIAYQTVDGETPNDRDFQEGELISATGTLTLSGQPLDTETVVLGTVTYTFQTVLTAVANNVFIGADQAASLDNLLAAVNQEAGEGTLYGTGTVFNPDARMDDLASTSEKLATARIPGTAGNTLATTETLTNGAWSAATLLGGLDLPTNSEFTMSALPSDVTGVRALAIVVRSYKTDSGTAELTPQFVKDGGFASAGVAIALPLSPTYFEQTIETDPETAGALTPSTLVNSRLRIDRTA